MPKFTEERTFEVRAAEASKIRAKYPDRIPVICEKADRSDIPEIDKKKYVLLLLLRSRFGFDAFFCLFLLATSLRADLIKSCWTLATSLRFRLICLAVLFCRYLVPVDLTVGQFVFVIRNRIKLPPEQAVFVFINDVMPPTASLMSAIYEEQKSPDGFLYITYSGENTFGSE